MITGVTSTLHIWYSSHEAMNRSTVCIYRECTQWTVVLSVCGIPGDTLGKSVSRFAFQLTDVAVHVLRGSSVVYLAAMRVTTVINNGYSQQVHLPIIIVIIVIWIAVLVPLMGVLFYKSDTMLKEYVKIA